MFGLTETIWAWVFVAVIVVFGGMATTIYVQHEQNITMGTQKTAAEDARDAAQANEKNNKASADKWEQAAKDANTACETYKHDQQELSDQNKAALASAQAGERAARGQLETWLRKYTKATQGACATLLNTPICVEALPNE